MTIQADTARQAICKARQLSPTLRHANIVVSRYSATTWIVRAK